jgi:serine/threonine protein kinase
VIDPLIGQMLGQYELQERLGQGGMATVYRGIQPALGRSVAIKVLSLAHLTDPHLPARFRREARLAASLMHPNIIHVYDFGEWREYLYIVMSLVTGGTLKDRMEAPLPVDLVVLLLGQVCDGLTFAHAQGIYHRDVKPANILLVSTNWAMIGDFGIARTLGDVTRLKNPAGVLGTPAYMAPEQWLGGDVDGRADIYALGVILFELLTGRLPFTATTNEGLMHQHLRAPVPRLRDHGVTVNVAFEEVVQTALAKSPEFRYGHAGEMKAALESALQAVTKVGESAGTVVNSSKLREMTSPELGVTMRVSRSSHASAPRPFGVPSPQSSHWQFGLVAVILLLAGLLAGAVGYILASGSQLSKAAANSTPVIVAPPTIVAESQTSPTTTPAALPRAMVTVTSQAMQTIPPTVPPTVAPSTPVPPTSAAPTPARSTPVPPTTIPPTPAPPPTEISDVARSGAPIRPVPSATQVPQQPFAQIEQRLNAYFAALNAGDYARARAVIFTPRFQDQESLDSFKDDFVGVTNLRYTGPFRYTPIDRSHIQVDVDYAFANKTSARLDFTLHMTFVPIGDNWLADVATASKR